MNEKRKNHYDTLKKAAIMMKKKRVEVLCLMYIIRCMHPIAIR